MYRRTRVVLGCSAWFLIVAANATVSLGGYVDYVQSLHPTGYYRLDETVIGTVHDSSGNGLDGVHDFTPSLNQTPGALAPYDTNSAIGGTMAVADFVGATGTALWATGSNSFSLSLWVKPNGFSSEWQTPLSYGAASPLSAIIIAENGLAQDGSLNIGAYYGSLLDSNGKLVNGQWNQIGLTYDGSTLQLYLNGAADGFASTTLSVSASPVGSLGGLIGGGQPYNGQLDEFAYWNGTALDAATMHQLGTVVPEPSSIMLLATGLIGLLAYAWRKRR